MASPPPPAVIREVTADVLRRPELAPVDSEAFWRRLGAELVRLVGALGRWSEANPGAAWLVIAILTLVLLALVTHLLWVGFLRGSPSRGLVLESRAAGRGGVRLDGRVSAAELLAQAQEALAAGRERDAIRFAHRALLARLDADQAIRFAGWKTNSRYLNECPRANPRYLTLRALTDAYERAVYGRRSLAPGRAAALVAELAGAD